MNFIEAVKAIKEGKKVRRPSYGEGAYKVKKGNFIGYQGKGNLPNFTFDDYEATDWEIVEEKKTLSDKGNDMHQLLDFIVKLMEEQIKSSLDNAGLLDVNVSLNKESMKRVNELIEKEFKDELIFDGGDVKEAIKEYIKRLKEISDFRDVSESDIYDNSKEIFGERLT